MRARVTGAVLGIAAAVVLAGCGSSGSGGSAAAAGSSAAQARGQTVDVKATEYAFSLPTTNFSPGTYTFTMADDGHASHAMEIQGPGISGARSSVVGPGGTATLTVTLQGGSYTLFCPVPGHRQAGMQTTLTVK